MSDVIPPPPPARSGDSCWKWGGITCSVGCGLFALIIVVLLVVAGPSIRNLLGRAVELGKDAELCKTEMANVWQQVEKFHADKGKYPDKLESLVPHYLPNEAALRCSKKPTGPKFTYHKPEADAIPTSIVLEYSLNFSLPDGASTPIPIRMRKDSTFEQTNVQYQGRDFTPAPSGGR